MSSSGRSRGAAAAPSLLCVANFASNTGYAWDFIEGLYAKVADALSLRGIKTYVAYPEMDGAPRPLANSTAEPVELDFGVDDRNQRRRSLDFIRAHNVRAVYMTDRESASPYYPLLRAAGVRNIVVHDHASGERSAPSGVKRIAKYLYSRIPGVTADSVVCVSNYVARRQVNVGQVPADRVMRIWNGIPIPPLTSGNGELRRIARVADDQPVIVCSCRANAVKGVNHLLRAFDHASTELAADGVRPALVYIGDGPERGELERICARLAARGAITFAGYRSDAASLLTEADICVVPSIWQDALPLGVLEPMAVGIPVIATTVGGIPEMIDDGVNGLLVPPGNEKAMSEAILRLIREPELRHKFARAGRERVAEYFTPAQQIAALTEIVGKGF